MFGRNLAGPVRRVRAHLRSREVLVFICADRGDVHLSADVVIPVPFAMEVGSLDTEVVLVLHGELDLWTQPQFAAALAGIEDTRARVVLDLADLTFIDAGNILLIHRAREFARSRGVELVIRSPSPHVVRILEMTGLGASDTIREELRPIVDLSRSRALEHAAS